MIPRRWANCARCQRRTYAALLVLTEAGYRCSGIETCETRRRVKEGENRG